MIPTFHMHSLARGQVAMAPVLRAAALGASPLCVPELRKPSLPREA